MLILTNCLTENTDEGALKLSKSLIKRIKKRNPQTHIVTYDRESKLSDEHLKLNKFLLNKSLRKTIKSHNKSVLYVPFPSKPWKNALRIFVLSKFTKEKLSVIMIMKDNQDTLSRKLLKWSRAEFIVFSADSSKFYGDMLGENRVHYLKAGVDSKIFSPVSYERSKELKKKYGFDDDKPIVLHVGHLQEGRNIRELLKISQEYQVLLVTSAFNKENHNLELKDTLSQKDNVRIIDTYLPNIEEIYQLADVYFFPVNTLSNCIDVPLSCMEAASCNKPIVTTDFGEMSEFKGKEGFYYVESFDEQSLNELIKTAMENRELDTRKSVISYDWDKAVEYFG